MAGLAAALNRVLTDRGLSARMGAAGRERAVREFGWEQVARRTVEVYESLAKASGNR